MFKHLQTKALLLLLVLVGGVTTASAENVTVTKTVNELVTANEWQVSSGNTINGCYTNFELDDVITISTSGEANCGSIWGTTTHDWRLYQAKGGDVTITAGEGYELKSVTFTYNVSNNGTLIGAASGTEVSLTSNSATFTVGYTGNDNKNNGQVRITEFSVTYAAVVTTPTLSVTPATTEKFTYEVGNGPAEEQIITIKGSHLTGAINASVTDDFEITDDEVYGNSLTLTGSENMVSVRMKSGLAIGEYTGALTIASEGAESVVVNLTGEVTAVAAPAIVPESLTINAEADEDFGTIGVTYTKVDIEAAELQFFDANGNQVQASVYEWLQAELNTDGSLYYYADANDGEARSAYMKIYGLDSEANDVYSDMITLTQAAYVAPADYATLPFIWDGGAKAGLGDLNGVSSNGLGSDYAESHNPYCVKFDNTGDYIQVKTDGQPGFVTVGVKMIGGPNSSSITVKASADGESFTDVETLTISGKQNDILTLTTSNYFAATDRYVRLEFTKGSNVGVGPITITGCISKEVSNAGMATFVPQYEVKVPNGVQAMIVTAINENSVTTADVTTKIPAGAPVVLKNAGTFNFPVVNYETTTSNINGNLLKVVTATEPAPAGSYVLYNGDKGVGFYEWTGAKLAEGRVYLAPATKPGSRSYLSIGGDAEMTGIESMYNEKCTMNNEVFDLQGRRVAQPVKGLYIVNGKKVIK